MKIRFILHDTKQVFMKGCSIYMDLVEQASDCATMRIGTPISLRNLPVHVCVEIYVVKHDNSLIPTTLQKLQVHVYLLRKASCLDRHSNLAAGYDV
jgi:hypothetical protein